MIELRYIEARLFDDDNISVTCLIAVLVQGAPTKKV